jgi:tripartite-type tricarboxylate transporter receptor subunit TctC
MFGAPGIGSASYSDTMLLADALDLNVDIIAGFDGTEGEMSMMRGEICAILGSISSFQTFVEVGNGSYLLTIGGDLEGVPRAIDFATSDRSRRLISIIHSLAQLGRVTAAPPGTSARQVAELQSAYAASLEDPQFLAEAERLQRPIDPAYGDEVEKLFIEVLDQSPETIEMIRTAINGGRE